MRGGIEAFSTSHGLERRRQHIWRPLNLVSAAALAALLAACADARSPTIAAPTRAVATPFGTGTQNGTGSALSAPDAPDRDEIVVVGTGDPSIDVPAVQAAVDQGGAVVLEGHFSFDAAATKPLASSLYMAPPGLAYAPAAEILVARAVTISGTGEAGDAMTTIDAGTIPFYVDAPGQDVAIRRLRFVRPTSSAIIVYAARDLEIASSTIAGVVPFKHLSDAIGINTSGPPPTPLAPGHPENVSGRLTVAHNDVDVDGGTTADNTLGIVVFAVGTPGAPVTADISGNRIRNTTEPAINFRQIEGRADVTHNVITTGLVGAAVPRDQVIRVTNAGVYRIANNSIECEWANVDAEAIGVFSNVAAWPIEQAVVEHNDVTMSAPTGTVFTTLSGGIGVFGFAQGNVVRHNTIRGHARAALTIPVFPAPPQTPAVPQDNAFIDNRFVDFTPAAADILVGAHALRTLIVGPGTVEDHGDGTIIVRNVAHDADSQGNPR